MVRGLQPYDQELFGSKWICKLEEGAQHLDWLLSKGYSIKAALQLVGDHFQLHERQRMALMRCSCSDQQLKRILSHQQEHLEKIIAIDGLNIIVTLEVALSGGTLFKGRDGVIRDLASVHGSYSLIPVTKDALLLLGSYLETNQVISSSFYIDYNVKNSKRLKTLMQKVALEKGWLWQVILAQHCDNELIQSAHQVLTADAHILEKVSWYNIVEHLLPQISNRHLINFSDFPQCGDLRHS